MDELGGYYAKCKKSDRERQITVWCHLCMEYKKYNKLGNITKKQIHKQQINGNQWCEERRKEGRGKIGVED